MDAPLGLIASYLSGRTFFVRVNQSSAGVCSSVQLRCSTRIRFWTYLVYDTCITNRPAYPLLRHQLSHICRWYATLHCSGQRPENHLRRLESCTADLQHWFWENDLLPNSEKLEVCFFGTRQKLSKTPLPPSVTVADCPITVSDKLKTLGVTLDAVLTIENYVNQVAKACNFPIWGLRHIRRSISRDVANNTAACIVGTRLDYRNSLLHGATVKSLNKLQRVQNKLDLIVCNITTRQQHIVDLLRNLHWLPMRSCITFNFTTGSINQSICTLHWSHTCHAVD